MLFQTWVYHFQANQNHFDHLDWNDQAITNEERKLITSSIQQFQRGEYSEGKHFMQFAKSMKDDSYCKAVKTFISWNHQY